MQAERLSKSTKRAIQYLITVQQTNGSFLSLSSPDPDTFTADTITFKSVFSTALIVQTLSKLPEDQYLQKIKNDAASFLMAQKSDAATWNYWDRTSKEAKTMPYPDDLDDTFCALAALWHYDASLLTGEVLAYAIQNLTLLEQQEGGPYKTWLVPENASSRWKDVDLGVNATIAYFLSLQKITLPNLTQLFDKAIETNKFTTPYYPNRLVILYFLSRFIKGSARKQKLRAILRQESAKTILDASLKCTALLYLSAPVKECQKLIEQIIDGQKADGSWEASAFYTGVNPRRDRMFYAGSSALTTTICLEAIHLFLQKNKVNDLIEEKHAKLSEVHALVVAAVKNRFTYQTDAIQSEANFYIEYLLKKDKEKQITLLPFMFSSMLQKSEKKISNKIIIELGAASMFGWMAYTIYDNFLDNDSNPSSLPIANLCLIALTKIFSTTPQHTDFHILFQQTMDRLEAANMWEVKYCSFDPKTALANISIPDYSDYHVLGDKSFGHALSCIALLMQMGYKKDSPEVNALSAYFSHYLIAKQLNDDAHDWKQDLQRGQINSIGALLLKRTRKNLEKVFWHEVVDDVCELITKHTEQSRLALNAMKIFHTTGPFEQLLQKLELSAKRTLQEKQNTIAFITTYTSKPL